MFIFPSLWLRKVLLPVWKTKTTTEHHEQKKNVKVEHDKGANSNERVLVPVLQNMKYSQDQCKVQFMPFTGTTDKKMKTEMESESRCLYVNLE